MYSLQKSKLQVEKMAIKTSLEHQQRSANSEVAKWQLQKYEKKKAIQKCQGSKKHTYKREEKSKSVNGSH